MVNGRIALALPAAELAGDRQLQQRLLGVKAAAEDEPMEVAPTESEPEPTRVFTVRRAGDSDVPTADVAPATERSTRGFTRWNATDPYAPVSELPISSRSRASEGGHGEGAEPRDVAAPRDARVLEFPVSATVDRAAYIAGTFDTKGRELFYLKSCLEKLGVRTVTVDLSTSGATSTANVHPREVARFHPQG